MFSMLMGIFRLFSELALEQVSGSATRSVRLILAMTGLNDVQKVIRNSLHVVVQIDEDHLCLDV